VASSLELANSLYKTPALVSHRVRCGRPNCRCATGPGHGPYAYLYWREGDRQRRRYVKQRDVEAVRNVIARRQMAERNERRARAASLAWLREVRAWLREIEANARS
jgi:hypothetical protein